MTSLISYQSEVLKDAVANSGLWIMAKGIGLLQIVSALVAHYEKEKQLVVVSFLDMSLCMITLKVLNVTPQELGPIAERKYTYIQHDVLCKERKARYLRGGVVFITSRIFIVDMLRKRIPPHLIGLDLCA
jgi:DNA excision repair protein ERCC-4